MTDEVCSDGGSALGEFGFTGELVGDVAVGCHLAGVVRAASCEGGVVAELLEVLGRHGPGWRRARRNCSASLVRRSCRRCVARLGGGAIGEKSDVKGYGDDGAMRGWFMSVCEPGRQAGESW